MREFENVAALAAAVDQKLGPSDWLQVTQKMINDFAEATGDRQWIHVDVDRAAREMPGGKTIAHGYFTLSLLGTLAPQVYSVKASRILNFGSNRIRFLSAVPADSRIRLWVTPKSSEPAAGGLKVACEAVFELEGAERPALIAETIYIYID